MVLVRAANDAEFLHSSDDARVSRSHCSMGARLICSTEKASYTALVVNLSSALVVFRFQMDRERDSTLFLFIWFCRSEQYSEILIPIGNCIFPFQNIYIYIDFISYEFYIEKFKRRTTTFFLYISFFLR